MKMRFALALVCTMFFSVTADANVLIQIDKSSQQMTVTVNGGRQYSWPISTGRTGFGTPNGRFRPQRLARTYFSRKYYNSPMPHSIFFHGGFAIHGSYEIRSLGGPASHGCVRLHPRNAATLFSLVQQHGSASTQIVVTGDSPMMVRGGPRGRYVQDVSYSGPSFFGLFGPR
jgi:lipoprotein-anchoring transpeptidase ErfK/SrfK